MNHVYHVLTDTAMSVLEMFSTSKEGIASFASKIINDVEDGKADPLRVKLLCKTIIEIAQKIDEGTREHQRNEASKYGDKPFAYHGAELHHTATYTAYDYTKCNDRIYEQLATDAKKSLEKLKQREEFLKKISSRQTMIDDESGEIFTINPPEKKQNMGVKVTIK